jgi:hypothetical protein
LLFQQNLYLLNFVEELFDPYLDNVDLLDYDLFEYLIIYHI